MKSYGGLFFSLFLVNTILVITFRWLFGFWVELLYIPLVLALLFFGLTVFSNLKTFISLFLINKDNAGPLGVTLLFALTFTFVLPLFYFGYMNPLKSSSVISKKEPPKAVKNIYFVQGHGEKNLKDNSQVGVSKLVRVLQNDGFKIFEVYLDNLPMIPDEADLLVFLGLRSELNALETEMLDNYLFQGGKVIFGMDPEHITKKITFNNYGVEFDKKPLANKNSNYGDGFYDTAISNVIQLQPKKNISSGDLIFPGVGAVITSNSKRNKHEPILFGEKHVNKLVVRSKVNPKPNSFLALNKANMYFLGDTDFVLNHYINVKFNREFFRYLVHDLIYGDVNLKEFYKNNTDRLYLSEAKRVSFLFFILSIPLSFMIWGFMLWYRKIQRKFT